MGINLSVSYITISRTIGPFITYEQNGVVNMDPGIRVWSDAIIKAFTTGLNKLFDTIEKVFNGN